MPGCAAVGCNNRSEKGYIMKCFPRDPKLRKIWQDRVARADWVPSNNSFLCHVHFEANEWCVADNGRVRLKKDAVPSIFTVTSTRKSPKKRTKLRNVKNESEHENECTTVCLENDTEHSSISQLGEKDSDSPDADDPLVRSFIYQPVDQSPKVIENKQMCGQYKAAVNNFRQEDIVIITDVEMQDIVKECEARKKADMENGKPACDFVSEKNSNDPSDDIVVKTEIKRESDRVSLDSYDEIEEKLKEICDGYREESNPNSAKSLNTNSRSQKEASKPLHKSINYRYSSRNEIGNMLTGDTDNIEIIFGTESGEECIRAPKRESYNNNDVANEIDKLNIRYNVDTDNVSNSRGIDKTSSEDMEETFTSFNKENIHMVPNIRAAMKRKWRTREEIMKSIEKSFASSRRKNCANRSDTSDNMEEESGAGREPNTSESMQFEDSSVSTVPPATTKFTIKVTGDPDDVYDIMQGFYKDVKDIDIQRYNDARTPEENYRFVTSVITIDDCPIETNAGDKSYENDDILSKNIESRDNDQTLACLSTLVNNRCARLMPHSDSELNDLDASNVRLTPMIENIGDLPADKSVITQYEYEKLLRKMKMQEDVIKKLTDQLISSKSAEKSLRSKCSLLEKKVENLTFELNARASESPSSRKTRESADVKQKLIDDISNRLTYFEEANKKLVKTISMESQQRKKYEGQIKQRDNQIKELNWKLEKASKFLERAEKNTNTYRRKMLNMQTFIRRKKQLEEKMSRFNQILINSVKQSYSGKTLSMEVAMDIKGTCGTNGYDRLLSLGFPLPMLSALRTTEGESSDRGPRTIHKAQRGPSVKRNAKKREYENARCAKTPDAEVDTKDSGIAESILGKEIASDDTETVTGTVQDIFEENDDDTDDFSANEFTEHFISQLRAIM